MAKNNRVNLSTFLFEKTVIFGAFKDMSVILRTDFTVYASSKPHNTTQWMIYTNNLKRVRCKKYEKYINVLFVYEANTQLMIINHRKIVAFHARELEMIWIIKHVMEIWENVVYI